MNLQVFDSKPGVAKQMSQYVGLLHQRMTQQLKEISPFEAVGDCAQRSAVSPADRLRLSASSSRSEARGASSSGEDDRTQFCSQQQVNLEKAISRKFP